MKILDLGRARTNKAIVRQVDELVAAFRTAERACPGLPKFDIATMPKRSPNESAFAWAGRCVARAQEWTAELAHIAGVADRVPALNLSKNQMKLELAALIDQRAINEGARPSCFAVGGTK